MTLRAPESSAACRNSVESAGSKPQQEATTTLALHMAFRRATCALQTPKVHAPLYYCTTWRARSLAGINSRAPPLRVITARRRSG
jgi:hypothetical protein